MKRFLISVFKSVFDGEGAAAAQTAAPAYSAEQQAHINTLIAAERRKGQEATQKALEEVAALQQKTNLTAQEKQDLEIRLAEINSKLLTKEELTARERKQAEDKLKNETTRLTQERDSWQSRYTDSTIMRTITDAAVANNAFVPEQIVAILRNDTRLVEVKDEDGKPTGNYDTIVKFKDIGKDGKPVTLELSVDQVVKRMKEDGRYQNLFKGEGFSGLGANNGSKKQGTLDIATLAQDPVAYRQARKDGKI